MIFSMSLENLRTYDLLNLSTKVCCNCVKFRTSECSKAPDNEHDLVGFPWSSLSACEVWTPNARTDEALQILTWRKLEGRDIEYPKDIEPKLADGLDDD